MTTKTFTFTPGSTSEFAAALHVLEAPVFTGRFGDYINREDQSIAWEPILEEPVSDGERVLVDLALCLWTGRGEMSVNTLLSDLDTGNFNRAISAINIRRFGPNDDDHLHRMDLHA